MEILKLDRSSPEFYVHMGPIFGSRVIEKETRDRFYDDPDKEWYLIPGSGAASVFNYTIKNFWAATPGAAQKLLGRLMDEYKSLSGIVSNRHEQSFRDMGFICIGHRKNFLEVHYRAKD